MSWTNEQIAAARAALAKWGSEGYLHDREIVAIMNSARDALAANGGTMTEEDVRLALDDVERRCGEVLANMFHAHLAAQGAKVAELEAEIEQWRSGSEALQGEMNRLADELAAAREEIGQWTRGSLVSFNENKALAAERDVVRADARCMKHEAELAKAAAAELREELGRERARTWVQCTSVSNECLAGCRTMAEHDRQRDSQLRADVGATGGESLRGAVLRVVRERDDARVEIATLRLSLAERQHSLEQMNDSARSEVSELRVELARLKPSGQVAEQAKELKRMIRFVPFDLWAIDGRIDDLAALAQRGQEATGALAAIMARASDRARIRREVEQNSIMTCVRWVVDGDGKTLEEAPTPDVHAEVPHSLSHAMTEHGQHGNGKTLDGVREQGGTIPGNCVVREEGVPNRCEDGTCKHQDVTLPPSDHGRRIRPGDAGHVVYAAGAEDMRAACWEAVATRLEAEGYGRGGALLLGLKAAIDGAKP